MRGPLPIANGYRNPARPYAPASRTTTMKSAAA